MGWLDEIADFQAERPGLPICKWCGQEVYQGKQAGFWFHYLTRQMLCQGQVTGGWNALKGAEPLVWRDAE